MYCPTLKTIFVITSLCLSHLHLSLTCGELDVDMIDLSFTIAYCFGWASSSISNRSRRSLRFSRWSACISFKSSKIWSVIWILSFITSLWRNSRKLGWSDFAAWSSFWYSTDAAIVAIVWMCILNDILYRNLLYPQMLLLLLEFFIFVQKKKKE